MEDKSQENCIICQGDTVLVTSTCQRQSPADSQTCEEELRDLRLFLCKVLSIPVSCFEYIGFPFCKKCTTTRVKKLLEVHNQLLALQQSYTSLKDNMLREIVTVFVRKHSDNLNWEDTGPTDMIIKYWKEYIADSGFSLSEDNRRAYKTEFVDFSEPDIKEEICELTAEESDFADSYTLPASTNQIFTEDTDETDAIILNFEACANAVITNSRQRKCHTTKVNYSENENTMGTFEDNNEIIRDRKIRKGTKRKVTFPKTKASNGKVKNVKKSNSRFIKKLHQCPHCPRKVRGTDALQDHIRTHTNERPYVCSECNQAFRQWGHLTTHKKLRHGYQGKNKTVDGLNEMASKHRTYQCAFCETTRRRKGNYIRHLMYRHMGEEIQQGESLSFYYCDAKECVASCPSQDQLKKHFEQSHKDLLPDDCCEFPECDICRRVFTMQENLEIHRSGHMSENNGEEQRTRFSCDYCYQVFNTETEKNEHLPRHKVSCGSSEIFCHLCDLCGKSFKDLSALIFHKRKVHNRKQNNLKSQTQQSRVYFCEFCSDQMENKRIFLLHLKSLHSQEINGKDSIWFYHCDVHECLASYSNQEGLKKHFQDNHKNLLDSSNFPHCDICQRMFVRQENLEIHKKSHNSDSKSFFPCDYCHTYFLSKSPLKKHLSEHKVQLGLPKTHHLCEFCSDEFPKESALKRHIRKMHPENNKNTNVKKMHTKGNMKTNKKQCPVCGKVMLATSEPAHMKQHTDRERRSCSICPHVSSTPTNLQLHMAKIHPSSCAPAKLLKHSCQYCEKVFYMPNELHKHSVIHHPQEYLNGKSSCCSCYKTFNTEEEMNVHFLAKHPSLICSVEGCGKKFNNSVRISLHMNTHNKEKPFICEYCQQGFAQGTSLQFHINTKHTFHRSFLCKLCPDNPGYYERRTFNKHLESEHPTCAIKDILIPNYPKRKYFFLS